MVDSPDWDQYVHATVRDDGTDLGEIVDVDREEGLFYLEPSREIDKNLFEALGWGSRVDYESDNWAGVDYEAWQEGEQDLHVDFREWPFALPAERVDEGDGDLQLAPAR